MNRKEEKKIYYIPSISSQARDELVVLCDGEGESLGGGGGGGGGLGRRQTTSLSYINMDIYKL